MSSYIEFTAADGGKIYVEIAAEEMATSQGLIKAGLKDKLKGAVAAAQTVFEEAIERVVRHNADAFVTAVHQLSTPPAEVEVTFALKATGELGNVAIGKIGGDANFTVKLVWKHETKAM